MSHQLVPSKEGPAVQLDIIPGSPKPQFPEANFSDVLSVRLCITRYPA
jgi:hypothetical protein